MPLIISCASRVRLRRSCLRSYLPEELTCQTWMTRVQVKSSFLQTRVQIVAALLQHQEHLGAGRLNGPIVTIDENPENLENVRVTMLDMGYGITTSRKCRPACNPFPSSSSAYRSILGPDHPIGDHWWELALWSQFSHPLAGRANQNQ